jgi:hypothetical protein
MNKKAESVIIIILMVIIFIACMAYILSRDSSIGLRTSGNNKSINSILPNASLAPGDVLTSNLSIICHSGYSATVRDVPQSLRLEVFARDGVAYPQPTGSTELDHIIPLCLGGSNDKKNLFVEFAEPRPGFHEKDKLEDYLCHHVCSGEINIDYAQQRIAQNWYSYYLEIYE